MSDCSELEARKRQSHRTLSRGRGVRRTCRTNSGSFQKGRAKTGGRKKGTVNLTTKISREAIIEGLAAIGEDGHGLNGLTGFVIRAARADVRYGVQMLGFVTPKQVDAVISHQTVKYDTVEEIEAELARLGLPPMKEIFHVDFVGTPVPDEAVEVPESEILPPEPGPTK
jgi:hypothetical protein